MGASPGKHDAAERPRRPRAIMANSSLSSSSPPRMMEDAHELSVGEVRLISFGYREKTASAIDRSTLFFFLLSRRGAVPSVSFSLSGIFHRPQ